MISCLKTNFKIEMSLPSRKIQQLWDYFTLFLSHFTGLNFKWKNIYMYKRENCMQHRTKYCKTSCSTFLTTRKTQRKPLVKFSLGKRRHNSFLMTLALSLPSLDKALPHLNTIDIDCDFYRNEDAWGETEKSSWSSIENQFKLRMQIISVLKST